MAIYFHTYITESNEIAHTVYQSPEAAKQALIAHITLGTNNPSTEAIELANEAMAKPGHWVESSIYGDVMIYPVKLEG